MWIKGDVTVKDIWKPIGNLMESKAIWPANTNENNDDDDNDEHVVINSSKL